MRNIFSGEPFSTPRKTVLGVRFLLALTLSLAFNRGILTAQQPTASTVDARARENPQLVAKLRATIASGRLTVEQIRARLRASGYPDSLLDKYLSDTATTTGSILT